MAESTMWGVCFVFISGGHVLLEQNRKKAAWHHVSPETWFVPGGRVEGDESTVSACIREVREEMGVEVVALAPRPAIEVIGPNGFALAQPFVVQRYTGELPDFVLDKGYPLRWVPIAEALASPVAQVRMIVAACYQGGD
jgi:8-oxo-dGTP pyrophosphatase MutT (NUDIX family)